MVGGVGWGIVAVGGFSKISKILFGVMVCSSFRLCFFKCILRKCRIALKCLGVCFLCGMSVSAWSCVWGRMSVILL